MLTISIIASMQQSRYSAMRADIARNICSRGVPDTYYADGGAALTCVDVELYSE